MLPKVNQELFIQVASVDKEEEKQQYKSRIADLDENCIYMEVPIHVGQGKYLRLYKGDSLSIYFLSDSGTKNYFHSEVVGFKEDNIRLVSITMPDPGSISQVQRRNHLRVTAELEMSLRISDDLHFLAITKDLSGGGTAFLCDGHLPIEPHMRFDGWLLLPFRNGAIEHAFFKGEIVRLNQLESGRKLGMVSFTDIADVERQRIIRFCFERQLENRKK
ncbi:glycosyl transferase [Xylanibacillus composti]|uniref:C-di-GMP-binding flagellar brake protein YcgR n=1 Tax=Xylanibacillus composti TaxID=1572762 RepID=A0A8J4H8Q0_9BACL|nr:flagellar brake domain-containing protein [Xylanibacillus composti]MDT9725436.1 glycosyl transferase [Xylanibacillus composti]GIQ71048.1 hypothetical protein XYCOK13_38720 [Xylanibacillus composti]